MKTNVMQIVRLVMMIVAVAGIIYALEYMERGIAVWFWITLLGVGFVGLLYTFRLTQRRVRLERRARDGRRALRRRNRLLALKPLPGAGHDDGGRPAGRGVDVRKYPDNSYLCRGLCHQFRIAAGVGESRVSACRDVPQGFFQERGVRGRLLLRITERRK